MNTKISDLMHDHVITAQPHHSVTHVRDMMHKNKLHCIPVIHSDESLAGIVSAADLAAGLNEASPISQVMTKKVYTIPQYNDVHQAARLMLNHRIHHVVVTHEQKVVGIISSFDLLKLVEEHRFVMKDAPTQAKKDPTRQ